MPPGPELAEIVSAVDRTRLGPADLLRVAQARLRLIAQLEAQLLADLHLVARTVPEQGPLPRSVSRQQGKFPWAEVECAFALRWTHARAAGQLAMADEVIDRLPAVHQALAAGEIDPPKAYLLVDAVAGLDDQPARAVIDRVLPLASQQTTGELRARLRRLVIAADPQQASRRARREITDRRVQAFAGDNGLASLSGYDLAPHRVAAVLERLDAIARAAKAAGDRRRADQLRADAFLDLLAGEGIAVGAPISDGSLGRTGGPSLAAADPPSVQEPDPAVPWPTAPADPELLVDDPDPDPEPSRDRDQHREEPVGPVSAGNRSRAGRSAGAVSEPPDEPPGRELVTADQVDDPDQQWLQRFWLASFDQLPATRPGGEHRCQHCRTGTPAGAAGSTTTGFAAGMAAGSRTAAGALPGPRRGVVDLVVPLSMLMGLSQLPGELVGWGPVIAEIARAVAAQHTDAQWRFSVTNRFGELVHHDVLTRRPAAADLRFIRARDRHCRAPGCRRAARGCDIDHTRDWVHSHDSRRCNLACLCRRHHRYKHEAGAELIQLASGALAWRTPIGMHYTTHPDRYPHQLEPAELLTAAP
jgi:hypothetical protein